ncbi:hypothetical protein [Peribacillus kribbensis]|uniref:hypothetical protein n=1 Tax=Peribacillus kribbensis TaxID=356658 RepID=UPI00042A2C96|nr:hypothetical protein [Peribacillus kribbensis]
MDRNLFTLFCWVISIILLFCMIFVENLRILMIASILIASLPYFWKEEKTRSKDRGD